MNIFFKFYDKLIDFQFSFIFPRIKKVLLKRVSENKSKVIINELHTIGWFL